MEESRDNCWYCGGKLIKQGDFDFSDYQYEIVTILVCSNCGAIVEYTLPLNIQDEEESE